MSDTQTNQLPPATEKDVVAAPDRQPTLSLAVAGTMEIAGSEDGARPSLLMLFMADGTVRWVESPVSDPMEVSNA
jgi:hypothetical protein